MMFDFDFCYALSVRARVGSGTITAIYYYYYYLCRCGIHQTQQPGGRNRSQSPRNPALHGHRRCHWRPDGR